MNSLVKCVNLTKCYSGFYALNNINIQLKHGRIIGLLGPNGSGKSTLMKLMAGVLTPTSGQVFINGREPGIESKYKSASRLMVRTSCTFSFIPFESVRKTLFGFKFSRASISSAFARLKLL